MRVRVVRVKIVVLFYTGTSRRDVSVACMGRGGGMCDPVAAFKGRYTG